MFTLGDTKTMTSTIYFNDLARLYGNFFNEMREWQNWAQLKLDEKEAIETAKESLDKSSRARAQ